MMDSCLTINDPILQTLKSTIVNNPNDFIARLAFADRLEELRLFPRRSELIRIQLRIHNLAHNRKKCTAKNCNVCKELLYLYYDESCVLSSDDCIDFPCYVEEHWVKYGFVSKIKLQFKDLLHYGKTLLKEVPTIHEISISDKKPWKSEENKYIWTNSIITYIDFSMDDRIFKHLDNKILTTHNNYLYTNYNSLNEACSDLSNACLLYCKEKE